MVIVSVWGRKPTEHAHRIDAGYWRGQLDSASLNYLVALAAATGLIHTLLGPDHYLPFIALARVRRWSLARTLSITALCGLGHVAGSLVLGTVGLAFGLAIGGLELVEAARSNLAAWLLMGFGMAYTVWGVRHALKKRSHAHWHTHADNTVHSHPHEHVGDHVHVHAANEHQSSVTPWILFTISVFGPCEVLIPQLMYPAAHGSWRGLCLVVFVFLIATVGTMVVAVALGYRATQMISIRGFDRYSHAAVGLAVCACGLAIKFGL